MRTINKSKIDLKGKKGRIRASGWAAVILAIFIGITILLLVYWMYGPK